MAGFVTVIVTGCAGLGQKPASVQPSTTSRRGSLPSTTSSLSAGTLQAAQSWQLSLPGEPNNLPTAISCAAVDSCMVVDQLGNAYSFRGDRWTGPTATGISSTNDVSCVSANWCAIISVKNIALYSGSLPWRLASDYPGPGDLEAISCVTTSFCMAVDGLGWASEFNGSTWSSPTYLGGSATGQAVGMEAIACPTTTFCVALDSEGDSIVWRSGSWDRADRIAPGQNYNADPSFNGPGTLSCRV